MLSLKKSIQRKTVTEDLCNSKLKTVIIKVRVTLDEKRAIQFMAAQSGDNLSAFVRKIVFQIYKDDIKHRRESLLKSVFSNRKYCFHGDRNCVINIRFTDIEKTALETFARNHGRSVSAFIRWVCLCIYYQDETNF